MAKRRATPPGVAFASVSPREWSERASHIWPNTTARMRHVVRAYQAELSAAGALVRVGRALVVRLEAYDRWLAKRARMVADYDVPANREEDVAKRFGRANGSADHERVQ